MYRFKHILAELNLDIADQAVAQYASMITKMTKSTEIFFSHVKEHIHARGEVLIDDEIFLPTQEDVARDKIKQTLTEGYHGYDGTKKNIMIEEGKPLKFLLKQIKDHDIDLVIIGRKPHSPTSRKLPVKLVRKAPCSVLIVPADTKAVITGVVVHIDFSRFAKNAVEMAVEFALVRRLSSITLLHQFQLPSGYSKYGKDEDEFCEIMKKNAQEEYGYFIEDIDFKGIEVVFHIIHDEHLEHGILEEIKQQGSDLIIIGASGRDTGAEVVISSVTEDLITKSPVPILAVKNKSRGTSLLEAIKRL